MFAAVGLDDKLRPDRGKAKVKVKVNAAPGATSARGTNERDRMG